MRSRNLYKMKYLIIVALCLYVASAHPSSVKVAEECSADKCTGECHCSSTRSPLLDGEAPQLIALTFDEAVLNLTYNQYWQPLFFDRKNPDGNPISGTFFVPHEYTDYEKVQQLYLHGFEIGVNSITKNSTAEYWKSATEEILTEEFGGQRILLSHFANIPIEDVVGARTPLLQLNGDVSINGYIKSNITYDNSWTSRSSSFFFPYTLDYMSTQECRTGTTCPVEPHPGFWELPIIDLQGQDGGECNALSQCSVSGTADEIAQWLSGQVEKLRSTTKAPLTLMVSSGFLLSVDNAVEGFQKFLDGLGSDVFLVSVQQIIDWVKNPVPLDQFKTEVPVRNATCSPINCSLKNNDGNTRWMVSCVPCPQVYPWLGNPLGELNP